LVIGAGQHRKNVLPASPWPLAGPGRRKSAESQIHYREATDPNSLEVVLLVAALMHNLPQKPDLALFAFPLQTNIAAKCFLLAWSGNGRDRVGGFNGGERFSEGAQGRRKISNSRFALNLQTLCIFCSFNNTALTETP
jgi:hypothetical protein